MAGFDYVEPHSIQDVVETLDRYGEDAKVLGGGQSLLVMLRNHLVSPSCLVSLEYVSELAGIESKDSGNLVLGAMTTHRTIEKDERILDRYQVLAQASSKAGPLHIRNRGTVGGSLCHNELGSDEAPSLLSLDARAVLQGPSGTRTVPLEEFFLDIFTSVLEPNEVLTHLEIPELSPRAGSFYYKHTVRTVDRALVGVAAVVILDQTTGKCQEARLGLGGINPVPFRAHEAEELLRGQEMEHDILEKAGRLAIEEAEPMSDAFASASYRTQVTPIIVRRALQGALERARAGK